MASELEFRAGTLELSAGGAAVASDSSTGAVDLGADASATGRVLVGQAPSPTDVLQELDNLRSNLAVRDGAVSAAGNTFAAGSTLPLSKLAPAPAHPPLPPRLGGTGLSAGPSAPDGALAFVSANGDALHFDRRLSHTAADDELVVEGSVVLAGGTVVQASNNYLGLPCVFAGNTSLLNPQTSARPAITTSSAASAGRVQVSVFAEVATSSFVTLEKAAVTELADANAFPGRVLNGFASVQHEWAGGGGSASETFMFEMDAPGAGNGVYAVVSDSAGNTSEVRRVV
jgi:hypothetical protein